jgi:hypothetical protein
MHLPFLAKTGPQGIDRKPLEHKLINSPRVVVIKKLKNWPKMLIFLLPLLIVLIEEVWCCRES